MRINASGSDPLLVRINQLRIQILYRRVLIDFILEMAGSLCILQIAKVLSQHFL